MVQNEENLAYLAQAINFPGLTARHAQLLGLVPDGVDFGLRIMNIGDGCAAYVIYSICDEDEFWSMVAIVWRLALPPSIIDISIGMPKSTGKGTGRKLLENQIATAKELGFSKILITAAGQSGSWLNGYYTWPRLGFDGRINDSLWRKMPPELREVAGKDRSVLKLCQHEFGKSWWKENGKTIDLWMKIGQDK